MTVRFIFGLTAYLFVLFAASVSAWTRTLASRADLALLVLNGVLVTGVITHVLLMRFDVIPPIDGGRGTSGGAGVVAIGVVGSFGIMLAAIGALLAGAAFAPVVWVAGIVILLVVIASFRIAAD